MLAVDELALRVAKNDSATALSGTTQWADGTPHPSSVTDGHTDR
jgi:hypothetical protein